MSVSMRSPQAYPQVETAKDAAVLRLNGTGAVGRGGPQFYRSFRIANEGVP